MAVAAAKMRANSNKETLDQTQDVSTNIWISIKTRDNGLLFFYIFTNHCKLSLKY